MAKTKKTITSVPKEIRNEVKSLLKQSKFRLAVVYVDGNTGTIHAVGNGKGTSILSGLIQQTVDNYDAILNIGRDGYDAGYRAGRESVTAA